MSVLEAVRKNWKLGVSDKQIKDVTRCLMKRPLVPQQQEHVKWPSNGTYFGDIRYRPFDQDLRTYGRHQPGGCGMVLVDTSKLRTFPGRGHERNIL